MFDLSSLQYNSEHPTIIGMFFTVLCSLLLGLLIAFTYDRTNRALNRPLHFIQAMILVTIVSATIIQAIGDSVARGLGILGALSIIRFRTTVKDPRNIVFMLGAIAAGIACGMFGFVVAIIGTSGFCLTAFLLYWSPFSTTDRVIGRLRVELPQSFDDNYDLKHVLTTHCLQYRLLRQKYLLGQTKVNRSRCTLEFKLKSKSTGLLFREAVLNLDQLVVVELDFVRDGANII